MDATTEQIEPPKLDIVRLDDADFPMLVVWCEAKRDKFPHFSELLASILKQEVIRRQTPGAERSMQPLPPMVGKQLSDCLLGSFCLFHGVALSEKQQRLAMDLLKHFVCNSSTVIDMFLENTPV